MILARESEPQYRYDHKTEKRKADLNGVSQPETVWEAKLSSISGISYQYQEHLRGLSLRHIILQCTIFKEHF